MQALQAIGVAQVIKASKEAVSCKSPGIAENPSNFTIASYHIHSYRPESRYIIELKVGGCDHSAHLLDEK